MGSSQTKAKDESNYLDQIDEVNIDELDLNKIDTLQMKAIKQLIEKVKKLEEKKSDRMIYKLPAINLCSYSLI